jgi:hypothetical protein
MFPPDMHGHSPANRNHIHPRLHLTPAEAQLVNDNMHGLHPEGFACMPVDGGSVQGLPGPRMGDGREQEAPQATRTSTRPRRTAAQSRRRTYDIDNEFTYE